MSAAIDTPYYAVNLRPHEIEEIGSIAARRKAANFYRENASYYRDSSKMEDERTASNASVAAECAVARVLNQSWTAGGAWKAYQHHGFANLPDVGFNHEVRRVREPTATTFAIRERDLARTLTACFVEPPEHDRVRVLGWIRGEDAWEIGTLVEGQNYKRVQLSALTRDALPPDVPYQPNQDWLVIP